MKKLLCSLLFLAILTGFGYSQTWRPMGPDNYNQPSLTAINALTRIALSSTGVPYIVFSDFENSYRLTVRKYNGSTWETVGNAGFTMGTGTIIDFDIAVDNAGIPFVSYPDRTKSGKISVMKFNGSSWELVGSSGFTTASGFVSRIATTSTGTPYVATQVVGTGIIVMQYNGTAWAQMGGVLAATGADLDLVLDNDVAYVTYRDGSAVVSVKKFNGNAWELVGTTGFTGSAFNPTLAFNTDHVPYVAYADYSVGSTGQATVKKYNGTTWETVGSALFSSGQIINPSLAFSGNTPYVVYGNRVAPNKADVMTFNGTSWVIDGSAGLSEGEAKYTNIAISSTGDRYIAFGDVGHDNKAVVMKHNGSNWANLGATCFSAGAANYLNTAVDANGSTYSVYQDAANAKKATVMKYNGSSWSLVGSAGFTAGGASYTSIALDANGTAYVAFRDSANSGKATVMKYSGSSWAVVGTAGFSAGAAAYTNIAIDGSGIPYVVYQDAGNGLKASVMKYDGSSWIQAADNSIGMTIGQANYTSIAINSAGNPYVICTDFPSNRPHLFYESGIIPGYWWDDIFNGFNAEYTSITIDANNKTYIA